MTLSLRRQSIFFSAVAMLLSLAITSCGEKSRPEKPVITVSLPPQAFITKQIAGERFDVNTFLAQGANPESYEPSMAQMLNLNNSDAYLQLGNIGFEKEVITKIRESRPTLEIIDTSAGIELMHGTHSHAHDDGDHCHHDADVDPHVWSSIKNIRVIAENTCRALCNIDPDGTEYYRANLERFNKQLTAVDNEIRSTLARGGKTDFVIWHPSLSYFARDYGLNQIALGQENKELSASSLKSKIDVASGKGDISLLMQRDYDSRQAEVISKQIGAKVYYINPLNEDLLEELKATATAIAGE